MTKDRYNIFLHVALNIKDLLHVNNNILHEDTLWLRLYQPQSLV